MRTGTWGVVLASAVALAGCDGATSGDGGRVVARSSVVASAVPSRTPARSVEERFGLPSEPKSSDGGVSEAEALMRWDVPPGWKQAAPSSMRLANFQVAGREDAECYLTILAGDGGGIGANVNRWLAQVGKPALGPAAIDALPRAKLFGRDAVFVDAEGEFTGMGASAARTGFRLLGLVLVEPEGSAFLKLTGPADVVAREKESFLTLAASFRSANERAAPAARAASEDFDETRAERAAGLVAHVPSSWIRVPEKPPRALDLRVDDGVECSITVLPGPAGGARANLDRWRGQLGLAPLDDAQFAGLERVQVLGLDALLAESSAAGAGVLGVVACGTDRSVFVKLTGPVGMIARHRAAFFEMCRTLEED